MTTTSRQASQSDIQLLTPNVTRSEKEQRFGQRAAVIWLYGLSGAGKSTLATRLERALHIQGYAVHLLDGDGIRAGLNRDLGFDEESRTTNIRRIAEVAKLFVDAGVIVICAAITPLREHRQIARSVLGSDFLPIYVSASFNECSRRDPKGLYRRALRGEIASFTGLDSPFEPPNESDRDVTIDTESSSVETALEMLIAATASAFKRD